MLALAYPGMNLTKHVIIYVCFLCILAHLSRRLMCELVAYRSLRRLSVHRPSLRQHFQTSSPLKPLGQLNSNFKWTLKKVWTNGPGHMTKMAAMPIYGKTSLKNLELGMKHWGCEAYQVCSNDDPSLTLTYISSRSSFAS